MAATWTGTNSVWGNKAVALGKVYLDGVASGAVYIGLDVIENAVVNLNSHTSNTTHTIKINTGSGATAINGMLDICSAVAGDYFSVIAWGR